MSADQSIFQRLQNAARSVSAKTGVAPPTQEYLVRHSLESFLDRLTRTDHAQDFVLKGGVLLAAYGFRRATKDADAEALSTDVTSEHLRQVISDVAVVDVPDGLTFDLESLSVQEIREQAEYPSLRVRVGVTIGPWKGGVTWDVSTGDPIVPPPRLVRLERLLGEPIEILGYAAETTIAEKGVTILERGITSTRWRDYIDIVELADRGINESDVLESAIAVARYRGVTLEPTASFVEGYGAVAQSKWAAWRRKEGLESVSEEDLDAQIARVSEVLDPIFGRAKASE